MYNPNNTNEICEKLAFAGAFLQLLKETSLFTSLIDDALEGIHEAEELLAERVL